MYCQNVRYFCCSSIAPRVFVNSHSIFPFVRLKDACRNTLSMTINRWDTNTKLRTWIVFIVASINIAVDTLSITSPSVIWNYNIFDGTFIVKPSKKFCRFPVSVRTLPISIRPQNFRFICTDKFFHFWYDFWIDKVRSCPVVCFIVFVKRMVPFK